jgi:hypothetical protein
MSVLIGLGIFFEVMEPLDDDPGSADLPSISNDPASLKYGRFEARGKLRLKYLTGKPNELHDPSISIQTAMRPLKWAVTEWSIPHGQARLTLADALFHVPDEVELPGQPIPDKKVATTWVQKFLEKRAEKRAQVYIPIMLSFWLPDQTHENRFFCWEGATGPDSIFINTIMRPLDCKEPWSSNITRAVYERDFDMEKLRYVHFQNVDESRAEELIITQIYSSDNGLSWPDSNLREWKIGTAEYEALLGTHLGRIVTYLLLGAFDTTRQINSNWTWSTELWAKDRIHMRFDIVPRFIVD